MYVAFCFSSLYNARYNSGEIFIKTYSLTVLLQNGPAASKHVVKRNKPVCLQFILLFVLAFQSITICTCGPEQLSRYSDSPRVARSRDRIPVEARFSAPVQTGPGAHPASYTMCTVSFPEVKRPRCGADHPPHLAPRLKKE